MRALDWIGRVAVLVLSTLATLAIVGSLVSVSAPAGEEGPPPGGEVMVEFAPERAPPRVAPAPEPGATDSGGGGGSRGATAAAGSDREIARWLRALTYAVLGLAGFVAVLAIVAMRAAAHLGAIADRR